MDHPFQDSFGIESAGRATRGPEGTSARCSIYRMDIANKQSLAWARFQALRSACHVEAKGERGRCCSRNPPAGNGRIGWLREAP